ncbi:hypothetical protein [Alkalibacterium indicireducens]|uniref:hypothetical protein n=1 Tax=Alkalibacterium indicireducens TaxID=398758 RepID=UPI0031F7A96D
MKIRCAVFDLLDEAVSALAVYRLVMSISKAYATFIYCYFLGGCQAELNASLHFYLSSFVQQLPVPFTLKIRCAVFDLLAIIFQVDVRLNLTLHSTFILLI